MQMMWLKIDVGLPRVLRRRTAFSTPRAPDGCVDDCVKYQTPTLRIIDYSTVMPGMYLRDLKRICLYLLTCEILAFDQSVTFVDNQNAYTFS